MKADTTGLTLGLLFLLIAALGLWSSLGRIDWADAGIALPLCLVIIGIVGLNLTRRK